MSDVDLKTDEYGLLFSELSDEILGALLKFFSANEAAPSGNEEKSLGSLYNYLDEISPERKKQVTKIAENAVFEEN